MKYCVITEALSDKDTTNIYYVLHCCSALCTKYTKTVQIRQVARSKLKTSLTQPNLCWAKNNISTIRERHDQADGVNALHTKVEFGKG